ncbi:small ubiquitin-related modifier [Polyporus arcularius HHB13444]|uniref:Small ubiquitin-related modifier n=1 Tax=Polyporus arcularius HHB13444 TaxID=1314778 RepID=A0A5C3NW40_9APHY|nr:small ubiquitin-related modifier [Polyporus arcularius HHB13444]
MCDTFKRAGIREEDKPRVAASVKITVCDQMGRGVIFRIKRVALLSKLQHAYACTVGQDEASLKFLYDGQRIRDGDTPEGLQMSDDDVIDVALEHVGG